MGAALRERRIVRNIHVICKGIDWRPRVPYSLKKNISDNKRPGANAGNAANGCERGSAR